MTSCTICGADLPPGAMFCGECGAATVERAPGETRSVQKLVPAGARSVSVAGSEPEAARASLSLAAPAEPALAVEPQAEAEQEPGPDAPPVLEAEAAPAVPEVTPSAAPDEHTRLPAVVREREAARFVLQFSTGECVTVSGTGLIGRRPAAQPGEQFETLVAIDDPSRSVSKTHLEFGQDGGSFWISDRFSANGTVVKEPERAAKLAAPGMRSRVSRGSRVEIGEQFFVVS